MAKKRIAALIQYHVDHDDDTIFTQIASVKKIVDIAKSRDAVELTCLENTFEYSESSPVLKLGDVKLSLFWDEADLTGQKLLEDLVDSGIICPHKFVFPFTDGTITKTFDAWIKELGEVPYEVKGEVMRDITLHVTSLPVTS